MVSGWSYAGILEFEIEDKKILALTDENYLYVRDEVDWKEGK